MARRNDKTTREIKRIARDNDINPNKIGGLRVRKSRIPSGLNSEEPSIYRPRGRRGIRARARANRIADRRVEGTYRQPNNGTPGNSP